MKNWHIAIILIVYGVLICLPPLVHGYIYPTMGDDAAMHLIVIEQITIGEPLPSTIETIYYGQLIIGYPLALLSQWFDLNTMYLWFNYTGLLFVSVTFYLVFSKLINKESGLIAAVLPVLIFPGITLQWYSGTIFNIINIGILFWGIYHAIKAWRSKNTYRIIVSCLIFTLAFFFHPSGNYLLAVIPAVVFSSLMFKNDSSRLCYATCIFAVGLGVASAINISGYPFRQTLDLYTALGLIIAALFGLFIEEANRSAMKKISVVVFFLVVLVGSGIKLYDWVVNYNSAITETDKLAIEYTNTLDSEYFSCSPNVSYWVYERFMDKEYKEGELPYISRNKPMTQQTLLGSEWYWCEGKDIVKVTGKYEIIFSEKDLIVNVNY